VNDSDLTADVDRQKLDETTVMGRTVYVSQQSETAYVPFNDELVSMTNLRAWNILLEKAKKQEIDGYEKERTVDEKEVRREREHVSDRVRGMARELDSLSLLLQPESGAEQSEVPDA
jgi:topoisomerase IA-like protein